MQKVMGFYKKVFSTLNPNSYEDYSESTVKNTFSFYGAVLFNALVIMLLVSLPMLFTLPNFIESEFSKVTTFTFSNDFVTSSPIMIPENNPYVIINYANATPTQSAKVILDNNKLYLAFFLKQYTIDFNTYKNALEKKPEVSNIFAFIVLMMLPAFGLLFYFYLFIFYLLLITAASIISQLVLSFTKKRVSFKKLFTIATYAMTATIFIDLIFFALGISFYYIQYLPFIIFLLAGISQNAEEVRTSSKKKMKGYIDVGRDY